MIHTVLSSATSCAGMRIGLLGGSFNPAHEGHLTTSLYALRKLRLDEIWWLVSPQNPLKSKTGMKAFTERVRLARAMAKNNPRIRVTDFEARSGTRYTVDTIRALRRQMPGAHFVWLMGADNFRQVSQWRNWKALFQIVPIAVFRRPGYAIRPTSDEAVQRFAYARQNMDAAGRLALMAPPAWLVLDNRLNPSSATRLRRKNARKQPTEKDSGTWRTKRNRRLKAKPRRKLRARKRKTARSLPPRAGKPNRPRPLKKFRRKG